MRRQVKQASFLYRQINADGQIEMDEPPEKEGLIAAMMKENYLPEVNIMETLSSSSSPPSYDSVTRAACDIFKVLIPGSRNMDLCKPFPPTDRAQETFL